MERQKEQRNRGWITWVLWSATILTVVLLILFREDENREIGVLASDRVTVIAGNGTVQEHIPENAADISDMTEDIQTELERSEKEAQSEPETDMMQENAPSESENGLEEDSLGEIVAIPDGSEATENIQEENDSEELSEPEEDANSEGLERPAKRELDPDKPMIALTFDDGPYRENTTSLLDLLEQYDARATFFVVGYHLDVFSEATLDAYRRGFQIGNHTASHPSLRKLSVEEGLEEIQKLNDQLNALGIPGDVMLRPPYGEFSAALKEKVSVPMIGWNVDSQDWLTKDADKIYEQLIGKVKDGDIVLLHDLQDETITAMQRVVPELVAQGFQLVTLDELFEAKGIEPEAGTYYCYVR